MIYFEFRLEGPVKVYDMADDDVILLAEIEAEARALPCPRTIGAAQAYIRTCCFQLEVFDGMGLADSWVNHYDGFRAGEVRAEWTRFLRRRYGQTVALAA